MNRANVAWIGAWTGFGTILCLGLVQGQTTPPPPPGGSAAVRDSKPANTSSTVKPSGALQLGIDFYQKGEYESAQPWLGQAHLNRHQLSAADQKKLDEIRKKNDDALKQRQTALQTLAKASELVAAGKYADAESLVKGLKSSKWLRPDEQQHVSMLSDTIKKNHASKAWSLFPKSDKEKGPDPDLLLKQAREAYEANQLDLAETLAKQSEAAGFRTFNLFADTPNKVLKDVEAARHKAKAVKTDTPDTQTAAARTMLKQAREAIQAGDLAKAKKLVKDAEALKPKIDYWEDCTVEKVKNEIAKAERDAKASTKPTPHAPAPSAPETSNDPKALVRAARKALDEGRLEEADRLARQAREANAKYGLFEDTPDKVLGDLLKAREVADYEQAAKFLEDARKKFEQGELDEAEKLTYKAEQLRKNYPIWYRGERPDKLRADIATKRKLASKPRFPELDPPGPSAKDPKPVDPIKPGEKPGQKRTEALNLLAQARQKVNQGDLGGAWELAVKVKEMNVAFQKGDDTPEDIFRAVEAIHAAHAAKKDPQAVELNRQKALKCLADARYLLKEGRLIEALASVNEAKSYQVPFAQGDDTPEACMTELQTKCREQIDVYTEAGTTLQKSERYLEALKYFQYVYDLSAAFRIDTSAAARQLADTQRLMAGKTVAPSDAMTEGQKLLAEAEKEFQNGNLSKARQLAEAVYLGKFDLKHQANEMLSRIDRKEEQLAKAKTLKFYDIGVAAFRRKDYATAAQYLHHVNLMWLDEQKRSHTQEMLASQEMQPFALKLAGGKDQEDPPGKVVIGPDPGPKDPTMLSEHQKKQQIARDAARVQVLQASQEANRLAAKGDLDAAIHLLESSRTSLRESGIDAEMIAPLFRQLDDRLRTYGQMREQIALAKIRQQADQKQWDVIRDKQRNQEHKKQVIRKCMDEYQVLMKEGKFKEAEAKAMLAREADPDDPVLEAAVTTARMRYNVLRDRGVEDKSKDHWLNEMIGIHGEHLNYPTDRDPLQIDPARWKDAKNRKPMLNKKVREQSPKDRETQNQLKKSISVEIENRPLHKAIEDLRELSGGVNFWLDTKSMADEGISPEQPVSCKLSGVALETALNLILRNCKLSYVIQEGVVVITTPAGQRPKMKTVLYPVTDLIMPVDNFSQVGGSQNGFLAAPAPGTHAVANNGAPVWSVNNGQTVGSPGGGSGQNTRPPGKAERAPGQTMEDLLIDMITRTIEPHSWNSFGGPGSIEYYPHGGANVLAITQSDDIQSEVELLLNRLRELQEVQVTVEVRLVQLSESFYERIGLDFDIKIADKQKNFFQKILGSEPVPTGFVSKNDHLENVIVGLTPSGNFSPDLDIPISISSFPMAIPPFGGYPNSPGLNGGIDFGLAFLSDIQVFMIMEAAQGDRRTNIMQAPKISLYNGQTANLTLTDTQLFVTSVNATIVNGQVIFTPVTQAVNNGLSLTVNAVVSADRRYVRLSLQPIIQGIAPEIPLFPITVVLTPIIADDIAGTPVPFTQFIQQPQQTVQTILTTVNVPDGGTVLLGGLKTLSEGRNEFGPPILSKIPYLSRLFRNVGYGREARSIMFMVTPRIIIQEEEEERLGGTFTN